MALNESIFEISNSSFYNVAIFDIVGGNLGTSYVYIEVTDVDGPVGIGYFAVDTSLLLEVLAEDSDTVEVAVNNPNGTNDISVQGNVIVNAPEFIGTDLEPTQPYATFVVTNTNDSGPGSLRAAIQAANAYPGAGLAVISYAIPDSDAGYVDVDAGLAGGDVDPDVFVISPLSALPALTRGDIIINGQSQQNLTGDTNPFGPEIVLSGNLAGSEVDGLRLDSDGNRVHGLVIQQFTGNGILVTGNENELTGNYIGTSATGSAGQTITIETLLFTEDFESDLSSWVNPYLHGTIVDDPLRGGNCVVSLVDLGSGGSIYSSEIPVVQGQLYSLTFEYLGLPDLGGVPGDLGGVIGFSEGLPNGHRWLSGTTDVGSIEDDTLIDDGQWHSYSVIFDPYEAAELYDGTPLDDTIRIMLEDFVGSVGVAGDALFDNIQVSEISTTTIPAGNGGDGVHTENSSGNLIGGLTDSARNVISGNASAGLHIAGESSHDNIVIGNMIGTNALGTGAVPNTDGVWIAYASDNQIGGTTEAERNIISGNASVGITLAATEGNLVQGNYIGTDVSGTEHLGNASAGVALFGDRHSVIGGVEPGAGNLISGNGRAIRIRLEAPTEGTRIEGNLIGTTADGQSPLLNADGIVIDGSLNFKVSDVTIGGTVPGARNVISGNSTSGVHILGPGAERIVVKGNLIGTDMDGIDTIPNGTGVLIEDATGVLVGGTTEEARNIISGNTTGVSISGSGSTGNIVIGNFIGTDETGKKKVPNVDGVAVILDATGNYIGGTNEAERNVISGNQRFGVFLASTFSDPDLFNYVQGNYIGTDRTGMHAVGNVTAGIAMVSDHNSVIGGAEPGAGNVISGNGPYGIWMYGGNGTKNVRVQGNLIGTTADGQSALANWRGIEINGLGANAAENVLIGGTEPEAANVISGNSIVGMQILGPKATDIRVQGNLIGIDIDGIDAIPNGVGVLIDNACGVLVSGVEDSARNVIAYNTRQGISIIGDSAIGNTIRGNSIHSNGGLRIDLGGDDVTLNDYGNPKAKPPISPDKDFGPNNRQNYPDIRQVAVKSTGIQIIGQLYSEPSTEFIIDFYAGSAADPLGNGEGQRWLGSQTITTGEEGVGAIRYEIPLDSVSVGEYITTTATNTTTGDTSEFSSAVLIVERGGGGGGGRPTLTTASSTSVTSASTLTTSSSQPAIDTALALLQATAFDSADPEDEQWVDDLGINDVLEEDAYDPDPLFADLDLLDALLSVPL